MTKTEVSELVAVLMASYPDARFPDGSVAAYEEFLQDLEFAQAMAAVRHLARTSKFRPAIAEIVSTYEALTPRRPRVLREWIPDPSPGDYRPIGAGSAVAGLLGGKKK